MSGKSYPRCYPSAREAIQDSVRCVQSPQTMSESYKLAFADAQFLLSDEFRGVRLQLEMMKPDILQQKEGVEATVVVFGGARIPDHETAARDLAAAEQQARREPLSRPAERRVAAARRIVAKAGYYEEARKLGRIIAESCAAMEGCSLVVTTGGGPGIMEAANRGAHEAGAKTVGHNIVLPHEQAPNPYITPELCFQFHYFAIRKMHFLMRARALVAFPGGYGTMDELFETLTLIQTKKIKPLPVILFCREFWQKAVNFEFLAEEGVIAPEDLNLFQYVETAEEAWRIIADFYNGSHGE